MSRFRRFEEIIDFSPPLYLTQTSILSPKLIPIIEEDDFDLALDLFNPIPTPTIFDLISPFEPSHSSADLLQIYRRRRVERLRSELYFHTLSDRVSALELGVDQLVKRKEKKKKKKKKACDGDRKYSWTAEIKSPETNGLDRKYSLTTEIKGGGKKKKERSYKWTAEIKGKDEDALISRKYKFEASTYNGGSENNEKEKDKTKCKKKGDNKVTRVVEIKEEEDESPDHAAFVLRQAFGKRAGVLEKSKGKRKELSPQDAAAMIQITFREYLIRRSQNLRALRELAIAKAKLKELRALFNNFSYRRQISRDAEERQKFTEKIIVLLLTVDAIEGGDLMVRGAKRSMVDELEAMLDEVDPQPLQSKGGKRSLSMKRRTFDMPDGLIQKEIAEGVAQVVRMLDHDPNAQTL